MYKTKHTFKNNRVAHYCSQNPRAIRICYGEHIKYGVSEKSRMAHHILNSGQTVDKKSLKLFRHDIIERLWKPRDN